MHMKYRDGYLCEYDDLWQLPVEILEDIIIRIYRRHHHPHLPRQLPEPRRKTGFAERLLGCTEKQIRQGFPVHRGEHQQPAGDE